MSDFGERLALRNDIRMYGYLAVGAMILLGIAWNGLRSNSPAFCGELVSAGKRAGEEEAFNALFELNVRQDDGTTVVWKIDETTAHYYKVGDYLVKEKRERFPAVFRQGKQVRSPGIRFYKEKDVDLAAARANFKATASASAEALAGANEARAEEASAPAPSEPVELAAPSEQTEEHAKALLDEAGKLWGAGDKAGALAKSEEALQIRLAIYGGGHPLVADARKRIEAAKRQMK